MGSPEFSGIIDIDNWVYSDEVVLSVLFAEKRFISSVTFLVPPCPLLLNFLLFFFSKNKNKISEGP